MKSSMLTVDEVLRACEERGEPVSLATLRGYRQRGLLPAAVRTGKPGHHKGSFGLMPVYTVDRIVAIRELIATSDTTLQELADSQLAVAWRAYDAAVVLHQCLSQLGDKVRLVDLLPSTGYLGPSGTDSRLLLP